MRPERFERIVAAGQFRLAQRGVDLAVADLVQKHDRPTLAALQLRDQVMQALGYVGRDRPPAQATDRKIILIPGHIRTRLLPD